MVNIASSRKVRNMAMQGGPAWPCSCQGRIKDSEGPGAEPNVGPLQTYNQLTTPTNCGSQKLRAPECCSTLSTPLNAAL